MKAIVYEKYGSPDVLELKEVDTPVPNDHEVLIKVYAASVNAWDWDILTGTPIWARLWGFRKPRYIIPGADIAGVVVEAGRNVTALKPGDEVFGDLCDKQGWGGFAEYVCANENAVTRKPAGMTFEQAASIPQAGVMALQSLCEKGGVQPGHNVLINGACGAVGTFAIQIAKAYGADVTGVDSKDKLDMMRSLGADHVIDYTREDFTRNGKQYDRIVDVIVTRSVFDYPRALYPGGVYFFVGGSMAKAVEVMMLGPLLSLKGNKNLSVLNHEPNKGLAVINELFTTGKVVPVIDSIFTLSDVPEAFRYFKSGLYKGKIVITLDHMD